MQASLRPWFTTGVALVGVGAIAMAPISPIAPSALASEVRAATAVVSTDFQLTALDWPYVLSLPIVRESIRNWAENWGVYLAGLGKAGVGAAQSLFAIPGVTVEIIQEVLALNFVGAFDTFAAAVRGSVVAVGQPLLDSAIWRNQKALLVQAALESAVPRAWIDLANGFLTAGNEVTTALIQGTQDFVAAVLTLNLGNIVNAAIEGTQNFFVAVGDGAGAIIGGVEAAQRGIVAALATTPPPPPSFDYQVSDVAGLRTLSDDTVGFARTSGSDSVVADEGLDVSGASPVVETVVDPEPSVTPPPTTSPVSSVSEDPADAVDPGDAVESVDPVVPRKKTPRTTSIKVKDLADDSVEKVTAGATKKNTGRTNDAGAKSDAGSETKSESDSDE
jgi:hypothetical protein